MKILNFFKTLFLIYTVGSFMVSLHSQVTIGSGIEPRRGALLDLKARQSEASTITTVSDDENITSGLGDGGLLLPRVKLVSISTLEPFIPVDDPDFIANADNLKERLAGLMVYNITNNGNGSTLYPAVYTWNGAIWITSHANEAASSITEQPERFTFYEQGTETAVPLIFSVNGVGTWTYQWYQITGNNVHVRIGTPIGGSGTISGTGDTTSSFTPTGIIKGTTRNANNTGFYKFYCIAESSLGAHLESDVAEVAVGCGAKNNAGEWISFMCFNLGADNDNTIESQKEYNIGSYNNNQDGNAGQHAYIPDEEKLWGSLFQWGRIPDGHELRTFTGAGGNPTNLIDRTSLDLSHFGSGNSCTTVGLGYPFQQVLRASLGYGKFITGGSTWTFVAQATADVLWRTGRFGQNDPCAYYKEDGTYQTLWHDGTDKTNDSDACVDSGTAWRTPTQGEWGSLYKESTISGSAAAATANTWIWYGGTGSPIATSRGYEVKPDGVTTTLFLPANGYAGSGTGLLFSPGAGGYYWSVNYMGTNAYGLSVTNTNVNPAYSTNRNYGFALRCIKNS